MGIHGTVSLVQIIAGLSLSEALSRQPDVFDAETIREISEGESRRELDAASERLAERLEKRAAQPPWLIAEGDPIRLEIQVGNVGREKATLIDGAYSLSWRPVFISEREGGRAFLRWHSDHPHEPQDLVLTNAETRTISLTVDQFVADGKEPSSALPPGRYKVSAWYAYAGEADGGKSSSYWQGRITTRAVEIEIKTPKATAKEEEPISAYGIAAELKRGDIPGQYIISFRNTNPPKTLATITVEKDRAGQVVVKDGTREFVCRALVKNGSRPGSVSVESGVTIKTPAHTWEQNDRVEIVPAGDPQVVLRP